MTRALARGTQSAPLYYHAGMIAKAAGDPARAEAFFAHAWALNPYLLKAVNVD
jgi:hypothetical protein